MKTNIAQRIAIGVIAAVMMHSEAVWADCNSEQQRIITQIQKVT